MKYKIIKFEFFLDEQRNSNQYWQLQEYLRDGWEITSITPNYSKKVPGSKKYERLHCYWLRKPRPLLERIIAYVK